MVLLMSIHKKYIEQIKNSQKRYEFRRRYPIRSGTLALIYTPRPISAITIWVQFGKPIIGDINKMLELKDPKSELEIQSLMEYFSGLKHGYAIPIIEFGEIKPWITLNELREYGIHPPQHLIYVDKYQKLIKEVCFRSERFAQKYRESHLLIPK